MPTPHWAHTRTSIRDSPFNSDFKGGQSQPALKDEYGHGTHVAGISAVEQLKPSEQGNGLCVLRQGASEKDTVVARNRCPHQGDAPKCKLIAESARKFGRDASNVMPRSTTPYQERPRGDIKIQALKMRRGQLSTPSVSTSAIASFCQGTGPSVPVSRGHRRGHTGYGTRN